MDFGADGAFYVADAGNAVYRVDPTTGEFALLSVEPNPSLTDGEAPDADASPHLRMRSREARCSRFRPGTLLERTETSTSSR